MHINLIFSKDRCIQLDALLQTMKKYLPAQYLRETYVLYRCTFTSYETLIKKYQWIKWIKETNFEQDFRNLLFRHLNSTILFLTDDSIFFKHCDLEKCLRNLEKCPNVIGFSLRLGENTTYSYMLDQLSLISVDFLDDDIIEYDPFKSTCDFAYIYDLSSSIYRVRDIHQKLSNSKFKSPNYLELILNQKPISKQSKMCCFVQSVAYSIPVNLTQEDWINKHDLHYTTQELYDKWIVGYVIDIHELPKESNSAHIVTKYKFKH